MGAMADPNLTNPGDGQVSGPSGLTPDQQAALAAAVIGAPAPIQPVSGDLQSLFASLYPSSDSGLSPEDDARLSALFGNAPGSAQPASGAPLSLGGGSFGPQFPVQFALPNPGGSPVQTGVAVGPNHGLADALLNSGSGPVSRPFAALTAGWGLGDQQVAAQTPQSTSDAGSAPPGAQASDGTINGLRLTTSPGGDLEWPPDQGLADPAQNGLFHQAGWPGDLKDAYDLYGAARDGSDLFGSAIKSATAKPDYRWLFSPDQVLDEGGQWGVPFSYHGKPAGWVYVSPQGWYWNDINGGLGRSFPNPEGFDSMEGAVFNADKAYRDQSPEAAGFQKFSEWASGAPTFGIAPFVTNLLTGGDMTRYAKALAYQLRIEQLRRNWQPHAWTPHDGAAPRPFAQGQ